MRCLRSRAPKATSTLVHRVMQANTGRETGPEQTVRRFLHRCGLRFRNDLRPLPVLRCAADLVFPRAKLCIFVDGCFWHGCPRHFRVPASNTAWWAEKIAANRDRDRRNDALLKREGWHVVRLWEHEVTRNRLVKLESMIRRRIGSTRAT
jgi:DNA mismatch endonuclease (patch repair protein)